MSRVIHKDVMLDLETLGRKPGCVILSIGACRFGTKGRITDKFYTVINTASSLRAGLQQDPETVKWWEVQSKEAQTVLKQARTKRHSLPLRSALVMFSEWLGPNQVVWGNGSDFDQPILVAAYETIGEPVPWKFYNSACYRSIKRFMPALRATRLGTHHNALDDALTQAKHLQAILKATGLVLPP